MAIFGKISSISVKFYNFITDINIDGSFNCPLNLNVTETCINRTSISIVDEHWTISLCLLNTNNNNSKRIIPLKNYKNYFALFPQRTFRYIYLENICFIQTYSPVHLFKYKLLSCSFHPIVVWYYIYFPFRGTRIEYLSKTRHQYESIYLVREKK